MGVIFPKRPLTLGALKVVIISHKKMKKAQPLISSPKGTISMKKNDNIH
jgi:hypothetical protein